MDEEKPKKVLKPRRKAKFNCEKCNLGFTRKYYVKDHITRIHKKTWSCEFCDENFKSQAKLKTHTANVHKGQKPFLEQKGKSSTDFDVQYAYKPRKRGLSIL